jgi:hypothetical protein
MRFIEIPALITEDIEDPSIVDITEPISASISGTTMTINGQDTDENSTKLIVSGEATVTLTGDTTVNAFTLQNIRAPSLHKISVKTNGKGNFTYVPNDTVTASSLSTTSKTGSDFEILLITTNGGETYVDFDMADYTSPALYTSNALTGFDISELTSTYGATAKLYKPDGTLLTTVTSATTGGGVNFGYTESLPGDVEYKLEVTDDLGRKSTYNLPRKWINYAMGTGTTPGFQKFRLEGTDDDYTTTVMFPSLGSSSTAKVYRTSDHGYMGINFKIQGRNSTGDDWVDIANADEDDEVLAFGNYKYQRVWVKPTAKATTTVSSSNVVTLTLTDFTEENVTTSFTGADPYDINESTNTYVFEETTKIGTVPFTVTVGTETYTNAVSATTEGTAYDYVTLAFANPTLSLTTSNVTISSAKLYRDDVLFHTYGTESNVVLRSDQTGTYQAVVNDVYYSNRVVPDFTTTRSVSAPQLEFDGYNRLNLSNITPTSTTLGVPDGTTRDLTTQSKVYIYETGTYTANVQTSETFAYLSNVVTGEITIKTSNSYNLFQNFGTTDYTDTEGRTIEKLNSYSNGNLSGSDLASWTDRGWTYSGTINLHDDGYNVTGITGDISTNFHGSGSTTGYFDKTLPSDAFGIIIRFGQTYNNSTGRAQVFIYNNGTEVTSTSSKSYSTTLTEETLYFPASPNNVIRLHESGTGVFAVTHILTETYTVTPKLTFDGYNRLAISNLTQTSSTLKYGSNTYDTNTASNVYVTDTGEYVLEARDANTFVMSNVYVGALDTVPGFTAAFHHGAFSASDYSSAYSSVAEAATAGFVYSDTPAGEYTWGTLAHVKERENPDFTANSTLHTDYNSTYGWTTNSGWEVSAKDEFSTTYEAWKAFSKTYASNNNWLSGSAPSENSPQWIKIKYPSSQVIKSYVIRARENASPRWPTAWKLQGSNNDSDWTDIGSEQTQTEWVPNQNKSFDLSTNTTAYQYYRLRITGARESASLSNSDYVAIGHWFLLTETSGSTVHTKYTRYTYTPPASTITANVLRVAGGGGGSGTRGGGGGAGGLLYSENVSLSGTKSIVVGNGGIGYEGTQQSIENGYDTVFTGLTTSIGGGHGGGNDAIIPTPGGSGGGGSARIAAVGTGAAGTSGQGNAGGDGSNGDTFNGGGGGGAGAVGGDSGGVGGVGLDYSSVFGTTYGVSGFFAGGGGGGTSSGGNTGGNGGGGGGSYGHGTKHTGGGGAGIGNGSSTSGDGGSGIVLIKKLGPVNPSTLNFDGYNKLTIDNVDTIETATIKKDGAAFATTTSNTVYIRDTGTYTAEVKGSGAYAIELSKVVGAVSTGVIANPVFTSTTAITTDTNWTSGSGWEVTVDSTNNSTDRPGWKAFDNTWETSNEQNIWHSAETATSTSSPKWLKIKYPSAYKAIQYSIQIRDLSYPRYPKTWKFQGSNNDSDWTDLDTQTNKTDWAGNNTVMFTFSNSTAYQYYRLYITATDTSDNDAGCSIRELKVYTLATGSQVGNVPLPDYTYPNTITVDSALSGTSIIIANDSHQVSGGKWYTLNHSTYIGNRFIFWDNAIGYWSYFDTQGNRPDSSWDNPGGPPGRFFMETDGDLKLFHGSNGSTIMHIKPNSSSNPWPRISTPSLTYDNYNKITLNQLNYEDTATVSDPNGSIHEIGTAKTMYVKDTGEYVFKISGTDKYVESNVYVSSVDLEGAPTKPIDFDGYNKLTLIDAGSNVSANVTYFSNTYELGSANVLYINGAGTYDLEMSGSNVFALSSNVVGSVIQNVYFSDSWDWTSSSSLTSTDGNTTLTSSGSPTYDISNGYYSFDTAGEYFTLSKNSISSQLALNVNDMVIDFEMYNAEGPSVNYFVFGGNSNARRFYTYNGNQLRSIRSGYNATSSESNGSYLAWARHTIWFVANTLSFKYYIDGTLLYTYTSSNAADFYMRDFPFHFGFYSIESGSGSAETRLRKFHYELSNGRITESLIANPDWYGLKPIPSLTFDTYNKLTLENFTTTESDTRTAKLTDPNGDTYSLGQTQNDIYIEDTGDYILEVTNSDQSAVVAKNVGTINNTVPESTITYPVHKATSDTQPSSYYTAAASQNKRYNDGVVTMDFFNYYNGALDDQWRIFDGITNQNGQYNIQGLFSFQWNNNVVKKVMKMRIYGTAPSTGGTSFKTQIKATSSDSWTTLNTYDRTTDYTNDAWNEFPINQEVNACRLNFDGFSYGASYWHHVHEFEAVAIDDSVPPPPSLTFDGYNKLSIENLTPTSTRLTYGSNTYDIGTASNVYIEDAGTYKMATGDANTFALVSNVVGALDSDPKYFTIFPSSITLGGWWGTNWSGSNYSKTSNTPTKIVYDLAGGVTAVLNGSQYGITFNATTTGIELDLNATGQADTPYTFTSPTITTAVTSGIITVGQTISIKALNGDEEATFTVPDFGYNIVPSLTYDTSNKLSIENITPTSTILTDPNGSSFDIGTATDVYIRDSGTYSIASKYANTFVLASNTVTGTPTGTTYVYDSNTFTTPSQTYDTTKTITVSNVPSHLSNVVGKIYKGSTAYTIHATTSSSNVIIENTGTYVSVFTTATQAFLTNAIDATQPTTTSDDNTIEDVAPSTSVDITLAFHYAGFVATDYNSAYATKEAAAANGFVYADTPDGTYSWGTLTVTSNTTSNTQYTWAISGTGIVDYLVVAGGGAGGNDRAGGGGAGGYRTSVSGDLSGGSTSSETPLSISSGTYSIIVGNGGQWGGETGDTSPGPNGNDSVFHTITSLGGGGGASEHAAPSSGGSGGGGAYYHSSIGNNGTAGQGTSGASGYENFPSERRSGGGGGASSAANLKDGGDGLSSTITGTPVIRGGGGGAGDNRDTIGTQGPGSGGSGGGGDGGLGAGGTGSNGVAHTGGGGGGGGVGNDPSQGGDGGSGIVIIKYTGTITSLSGSTAVPTETTTDAPSVTLDATDTTVTDPTLDLDFTTILPRTLKRYNGVTNSSIGARFNRRESNKKRIEKSISIPTSFSAELTANNASSPTTLTVTVANSKFVINGDETPTLGFIRGETYTFDQSDASNSGHPLVLATSEDGATQYTTGWTASGTPGTDGSHAFIVPYDVPDTIYYKCTNHANMGGEINTTFGNVFSLGDFTVAANTHVSGEYMLATNYDGTTSNLYVNGFLITQTTPSPAISAGVKEFILGKEFDGYVKNFKFWNYAKRFFATIIAFHHDTFANSGDPYNDGSVTVAAANGHVFSDTDTSISYTWGTLGSANYNNDNTTYTWTPASAVTAKVLMVAGGGGGGNSDNINGGGGGGGAGGLVYNSSVSLSGQKTITVGGPNSTVRGDGTGSTFTGLTSAVGGGKGAGAGGGAGNGGSGGGAFRNGTGGAGTEGQGYAGGDGNSSGGNDQGGSGGGGAGGGGAGANGANGANGGVGLDYSSVFGTAYGDSGWFASGGGGGFHSGSPGTASNGGGGNGGSSGGSAGGQGQKHTGGGGGGGSIAASSNNGSYGGSGIVLIKY